LSTVAHSITHDNFSASHWGTNLVASFANPKFTPYLAAGFDRTRLVVKNAADPLLVGDTVTTIESRFTAGLSYRPWPFIYFQAAYTLAHGQPGADTGVGVRF